MTQFHTVPNSETLTLNIDVTRRHDPPMPNFKQFPQLIAIDGIDFTLDTHKKRRELAASIPSLRARLNEAIAHLKGLMTPPSNSIPLDDSWGNPALENYLFAKGSTQLAHSLQAYKEASHNLDLLEYSSDPVTLVASQALGVAHRHLKRNGFSGNSIRQNAEPRHPSGQSVAEVIWQGRNQDQHWSDDRRLHSPCRLCFSRLFKSNPSLFDPTGSVSDDESLDLTLSERSFAPEVVLALDWTTGQRAADDIEAIVRNPDDRRR
jgi:hypothetical protein